ncbi:MAG: hypothetical protein KKC71_06680 [Chloroflexi bacterium]|nr:hypothetical protein [Chloroflexota bacterium]
MGMYTDPTRIHPTDPGHVEGNPVFAYLDVFHPDRAEVDELKARYRAGKVGDVPLKKRLADVVNACLAALRQRRADLIARPDELRDILRSGIERARPIAEATLEEVIMKMGLCDLSASR